MQAPFRVNLIISAACMGVYELGAARVRVASAYNFFFFVCEKKRYLSQATEWGVKSTDVPASRAVEHMSEPGGGD